MGNKNKQEIEVKYCYNASGVVEVYAKTIPGSQVLTATKCEEIGDMSWLDTPPNEQSGGRFGPRTTLLALDLSGSMSTSLDKAKEAALEFSKKLIKANNKIGIIGVADEVKLYGPPSDNLKDVEKHINSMRIGDVGGANSAQPFTLAREELSGLKGENWLIVLSDGQWSHQDHAVREAKLCHNKNIIVVGIGFGSADTKFLQDISNSNIGSCFTDLNNLVGSFSKIASEISSGKGKIIKI